MGPLIYTLLKLYNDNCVLLTTDMERENPYRINLEELHRQQNVVDMRMPENEAGIIVRAGLDIFGTGNIVNLMSEAPDAFLTSKETLIKQRLNL